jgi:nitric oxide reductase large subunit
VVNVSRVATIAVLTALGIFGTPARALACPVCGLGGTQDNWMAYGAMSVILSVLPLGMIGSLAFWAYRKYR